jgi:hypothetical protein
LHRNAVSKLQKPRQKNPINELKRRRFDVVRSAPQDKLRRTRRKKQRGQKGLKQQQRAPRGPDVKDVLARCHGLLWFKPQRCGTDRSAFDKGSADSLRRQYGLQVLRTQPWLVAMFANVTQAKGPPGVKRQRQRSAQYLAAAFAVSAV